MRSAARTSFAVRSTVNRGINNDACRLRRHFEGKPRAERRGAPAETRQRAALPAWPGRRGGRTPCGWSLLEPRRQCAAAAAAEAEGGRRWDITPDRWVQFKYEQEDLDRFPSERGAFRGEPRLKPEGIRDLAADVEMDWNTILQGAISCTRLGDLYTTRFQDLCMDRFAESPELMEHFGIPALEDKEIVYVPHDTSVPQEGDYLELRMQAYWLALHVWLVHSKQHAVQEGEGLFGSALCALITRRLFEFQWDRIRLQLYARKVPVMSITNELQDLQEFVFGLCVALDDIFREEGALGPGGTASALGLGEAELSDGCLGLAPRLKYALWSNVYSGLTPHSAVPLYELTVYLLRQRMLMEALPRGTFFMGHFKWADFPMRDQPVAE